MLFHRAARSGRQVQDLGLHGADACRPVHGVNGIYFEDLHE